MVGVVGDGGDCAVGVVGDGGVGDGGGGFLSFLFTQAGRFGRPFS